MSNKYVISINKGVRIIKVAGTVVKLRLTSKFINEMEKGKSSIELKVKLVSKDNSVKGKIITIPVENEDVYKANVTIKGDKDTDYMLISVKHNLSNPLELIETQGKEFHLMPLEVESVKTEGEIFAVHTSPNVLKGVFEDITKVAFEKERLTHTQEPNQQGITVRHQWYMYENNN